MGASKDHINPVSTWCKYFFDPSASHQPANHYALWLSSSIAKLFWLQKRLSPDSVISLGSYVGGWSHGYSMGQEDRRACFIPSPHPDFLQDFKQVIRGGGTGWTVERVGQSSGCTNSVRVRNEGGKVFSALGTYSPCLKIMGCTLLFLKMIFNYLIVLSL